jgi:hypothetical protein
VHGEGLVFSATIAASMTCSIDNQDETFVEVFVTVELIFDLN